MPRQTYSMAGLKDYLNECFVAKKSSKPFTDQDLAGYISRGQLPEYLGGAKIKRAKQLARKGQPLYFLVENSKIK